MSKNIRVNCTVTEFKTEKEKTRVEDYGFKKNELKIEEGIMELNVGTATPEMNIPISEEEMHHIAKNLQRRPTAYAMRVKSMLKSKEFESR